jgi:hypothetical protein
MPQHASLSLKIQYPGIRDSIDSDVNNVARLLKLFHWIPEAIDFAPLLAEAQRQLHQEADYQQEAEWLTRFAARLEGHPDFAVPTVVAALTTPHVLAMRYLEGRPIEDLEHAAANERNRVADSLTQGCCRSRRRLKPRSLRASAAAQPESTAPSTRAPAKASPASTSGGDAFRTQQGCASTRRGLLYRQPYT